MEWEVACQKVMVFSRCAKKSSQEDPLVWRQAGRFAPRSPVRAPRDGENRHPAPFPVGAPL
jgi:hypothetical protein